MPETLVFVDPLGGVHDLGFATPRACAPDAMLNRFMPPSHFVERVVPGQAGSHLDVVVVDPREVTVPTVVQAASESALRTALRSLCRSLAPTGGDGFLRATAADATVRQLACRLRDGLSLEESWGKTRGGLGSTWLQKAVLVFRAFDPYWYDVAATALSFTAAAGTPFFPILPLTLASSQVFAQPTVTILGDAETWPVWTVTGPTTGITVANLTTGDSLTLNVTLTGGQSLVIDTRPGIKTVTGPNGENLYGSLVPTSVLWKLATGANIVQLSLIGSGVGSQIDLRYWERWLAP